MLTWGKQQGGFFFGTAGNTQSKGGEVEKIDTQREHEQKSKVVAIGLHVVAGDAGRYPAAAAALLRGQEEEEEEAGQDVQHKLQVGRFFAILFIPDHT